MKYAVCDIRRLHAGNADDADPPSPGLVAIAAMVVSSYIGWYSFGMVIPQIMAVTIRQSLVTFILL